MKSRLSRRFHSDKEAQELNITAFMNLMVILVPFLLITAVFTQITILELNLPGPSQGGTPPEALLELEVIVRTNVIDIQDRKTGLLKSLAKQGEQYDTKALSTFLRQVKARYPGITNASILLEKNVPYEILVQMMDTVRAYTTHVQDDSGQDSIVQAELFPDISIGDAPLPSAATENPQGGEVKVESGGAGQ